MTDLRADREKLLIRWHPDLANSFRAVVSRVLDDFEALDEAHNLSELPRTGAEAAEWARPAQPAAVTVSAPTDDQIGEWIRAHDHEFAAWVRQQDRITGGEFTRQPAGTLTPDEAALLDREMGRTRQAAEDLLAPAEQAATPAKPPAKPPTRRRTRT